MVCAEFVLEKWLIRVKSRASKNHLGNMTDPISDMLNSIRNAQAVLKETVSLPFSKMKYEIALILQKNGLIKEVEKKGRKEKKLALTLYKKNIISGLKRVSRSGQRIYVAAKDIKPVKGGYGLAIISTSKGLMTNREAKKNKLGGEIICEIW